MKLVRDNIPEIAKRNGDNLQFRVAEEHEKFDLLVRKLKEETDELLQANSDHEKLEEIVDVVEVLACLVDYIGLDDSKFVEIADDKLSKRGSFKNWVVME